MPCSPAKIHSARSLRALARAATPPCRLTLLSPSSHPPFTLRNKPNPRDDWMRVAKVSAPRLNGATVGARPNQPGGGGGGGGGGTRPEKGLRLWAYCAWAYRCGTSRVPSLDITSVHQPHGAFSGPPDLASSFLLLLSTPPRALSSRFFHRRRSPPPPPFFFLEESKSLRLIDNVPGLLILRDVSPTKLTQHLDLDRAQLRVERGVQLRILVQRLRHIVQQGTDLRLAGKVLDHQPTVLGRVARCLEPVLPLLQPVQARIERGAAVGGRRRRSLGAVLGLLGAILGLARTRFHVGHGARLAGERVDQRLLQLVLLLTQLGSGRVRVVQRNGFQAEECGELGRVHEVNDGIRSSHHFGKAVLAGGLPVHARELGLGEGQVVRPVFAQHGVKLRPVRILGRPSGRQGGQRLDSQVTRRLVELHHLGLLLALRLRLGGRRGGLGVGRGRARHHVLHAPALRTVVLAVGHTAHEDVALLAPLRQLVVRRLAHRHAARAAVGKEAVQPSALGRRGVGLVGEDRHAHAAALGRAIDPDRHLGEASKLVKRVVPDLDPHRVRAFVRQLDGVGPRVRHAEQLLLSVVDHGELGLVRRLVQDALEQRGAHRNLLALVLALVRVLQDQLVALLLIPRQHVARAERLDRVRVRVRRELAPPAAEASARLDLLVS
mmetsp:Transcript_61320/g.168285  ORF Transcript_61320/g.168285 Transcript_61320/m.168285 type:complete len:663 (-) Transcript_61320:1093-3081(-)